MSKKDVVTNGFYNVSHVAGRTELFDDLFSICVRYGYLSQRDMQFCLRMVAHKVGEGVIHTAYSDVAVELEVKS